MRGVRSPKRRVRDDDFVVGLSSDYPRIVFILATVVQGILAQILNSEFRGRRSIWRSWRMTPVAPHSVNDVSYVTRVNHEIHFSWQVQYLVKLEDDSCCPAQCKRSFIVMRVNDEIHFSWQAQYLVKLEGDSCCSTHCK